MHALTEFHGLPCIDLSLPAGDRVRIALHGAHVLSWTTADGTERLYLSPKAHLDGRNPIRGGVPLCFPQFNQRELGGVSLPKHGFARTQAWTLAEGDVDTASAAQVRLVLTSTPETRALWPHEFEASLTVRLEPASLRFIFEVANTGTDAFEFALALHTYLRTGDVAQTTLDGLGGLGFWDAVEHLQQPHVRKVQPAAPLGFDGETDRVYAGVTQPLVMSQPGSRLEITQSASLPDAVVWNPGPVRCATLDDMPADGWRYMACVEAARINQPVSLLPGTSWTGWQGLRLA
ncbi:MAG: D-hexose-6-phosphate mutarotase [Polaromonas sp.]|nr:D-hexose-6-phosphate mutarotase [Polaromonas sp.]